MLLKTYKTRWQEPEDKFCHVGVLDVGGQVMEFVSGLTDVDVTAKDQLGAVRAQLNGEYKYVQFGATRTTNVTASLAPGDVACYVLGAGSADLNRLTLVDSANSTLGAGVVMGTIPATGGPYFGWLQIKGCATLDQTCTGSNGNNLSVVGASAKHLAVSAALTSQICAIMVDSSVGAAPVVDLDFPY